MPQKRIKRRRTVSRTKRRTIRSAIVCSATPKVSVVIPAVNERRTIASVIRQSANVHPQTEVIVVCNGSKDGTDRIAQQTGAKVITYPEPLGHDVGRSLGAQEAKGDILLFVDGDFVIPAHKLRPLVHAVEHGQTDIALNRYLGPLYKRKVHSVVLAKHALNAALSQSHLQGMSMTTIPHAISRNALQQIGVENLAVPPKAQAIALQKGLRLAGVHYIDVGNPNRRRRIRNNPLEGLIVGDHLEAIHWMLKNTDRRGRFTDLNRARGMVNW